MTTYTWTVANTEFNVADGGVIVAHWRCVAQDGDYSSPAYGTTDFTPDPDAPDFIPYADLTEADVLGWVWGSVDKTETEANLTKQIQEKKAPKTQSGLPWTN